jgi:DNA-binding transcriptional MerR regulator
VYRVHEFARLAGVTVKALYHYDRLGLLKPRRTDSGYRLYAASDLERLEHIVALKFLGLPLKQIKVLLDRETLPLPDALRLQRTVLEERRRLLDRAISAIQDAERAIRPERSSHATALRRLIEVIAMRDELDVMKKYYAEGAWATWKQYYEQWPGQGWRDLYRDVEASLGEEPTSERAQSLATRWLALVQVDTAGDPASYASWWRAWIDRRNWPTALQERMAMFNVDAIMRFISEAAWTKGELQRQKQGTRDFRAPDRVSESRMVLFHDIEASLREDPLGERAQALVSRWHALLESETAGDQEIKATMMKAWAGRWNWPAGLRQYVASLYRMNVEAWERVADFLDHSDDGSRRAAG